MNGQPTSQKFLKEVNDRKMVLLQSQIYQLKRQISVLREQNEHREIFVYGAKEQVDTVLDQLKTIKEEGSKQSVEVKKSKPFDKETLSVGDSIKRLEALSKFITRGEKNRIRPVSSDIYTFSSSFLKSSRKPSVFDICDPSLGLELFNLAQMGRLEALLSRLFRNLVCLEILIPDVTLTLPTSVFQNKLGSLVKDTVQDVGLAVTYLSSVASLVPASPSEKLEDLIGEEWKGKDIQAMVYEMIRKVVPSEMNRQSLQSMLTTVLRSMKDNEVRIKL